MVVPTVSPGIQCRLDHRQVYEVKTIEVQRIGWLKFVLHLQRSKDLNILVAQSLPDVYPEPLNPLVGC